MKIFYLFFSILLSQRLWEKYILPINALANFLHIGYSGYYSVWYKYIKRVDFMAIYAFRAPSNDDYNESELREIKKFLTDSVCKDFRMKFGYSLSYNLRDLERKNWGDMNSVEALCYKQSHSLLDIRKGDWIVQINLPDYGKCIAAQADGEYAFGRACDMCGDFEHEIPVDKNTIVVFDRNDSRVLPIVSSRLKNRRFHWKIGYESEFFSSIENIKEKPFAKVSDRRASNLFHLKEEFGEILEKLVQSIHDTHLGKDLEYLIAEVFRKIPNVDEVIENGSAHKGDCGADLIVSYHTSIPGFDTERYETMVVQIKSYEGDHCDTNAVEQLENAIKIFNADSGLIITTGITTEQLKDAFEKLRTKLNKGGGKIPISLISGEEVARFVLKNACGMLLED